MAKYFCEYLLLFFNKPVYSCKDTTALDVACSALGIAYSARDARRVKLPFALDARRGKLPFALGVAYLTTKLVRKFHSLSTIQAVMQNQQIFFFLS